MHFPIGSSISSDPENPGMFLVTGRRHDSRDTVVAEKKVPPLVCGNDTKETLLFCGIAQVSENSYHVFLPPPLKYSLFLNKYTKEGIRFQHVCGGFPYLRAIIRCQQIPQTPLPNPGCDLHFLTRLTGWL